MELTLKDLKACERGLIKLMNSALPAGSSFRLMGILRPVRERLQLFEEARIGLMEKLGEKQEDGSIKIDPSSEAEKKFYEELDEIMKEKVVLDNFVPLTISGIAKAELSAVELEPLIGKFIVEDDQEQEEK